MSDNINEPEKDRNQLEHIKVYGLPEGVIMWPTAILAIILGTIGYIFPNINLTWLFFLVFTTNVIFMFYEFSRGVTIGLFGLLLGIISIFYSFNIEIPFNILLNEGVFGTTSPPFLLFYGLVFTTLLIFAIFSKKFFDYFEISSNEIVKKTGILGNAERYPAPSLAIHKEIPDVFESLLLGGSGDLVIDTSEGKEFHLSNVPRINNVESKIRRLLGKIEVDTN